LLYQQPASSNSFSLSAEAEADSSAIDSDITANDSSVVAYEEDPGVPEPPTTTVPSTTVPPTVDATPAPAPSPIEPIAPAKPTPTPAPTPAVPTASPAQLTREVPVEAVAATEPPIPTTSSPVTSVSSAPQFTSAMTKISIGKITKVGKHLRVTVKAPKGSKVSLYRNGKLVGKGTKKVFLVPVSKVKKQNFTAVISVSGAFVSSASVSLPVRSTSVR
jgi:flagellar motor switch/type III secretory pathway protein FliN